MNILPPRIKGPVSECSESIQIQSQFVGATVMVVDINSGQTVVSDVATSTNQSFSLSVNLTSGNRLAVKQILGMTDSGFSADTVQIQQKPATIAPVAFRTPLFECARCVWIEGAVPGAKVFVEDINNGVQLGASSALYGVARVGLSLAISASSKILAYQVACGDQGQDTLPPGPLPAIAGKEQGRLLPPPTVDSPLFECQNRVNISDVFPGARVELKRSVGSDLSACFDLPSLYFGVNPGLNLAETLQARQYYLDCEQESPWSDPKVVGLLEPVPSPIVKSPLCKGNTSVTVCRLMAGAIVRLTIAHAPHHDAFPTGGTVYEAVAPEDGCFDFAFPSPGLAGGMALYATQELCTKVSEPSNVVLIDEAPASLPTPEIAKPLYECATVVHVRNLHPGTRVFVWSQSIGVIGEAQVFTEEMDIPITPLLQVGDLIYAHAIGCGHQSPDSAPVEVQSLQDLNQPKIVEPLYSCDRFVRVENVVPGAWVDIYVNSQWRGRTVAGTEEVEVPLQIGHLEINDDVTACQSLCGQKSELSEGIRVKLFDGEWQMIGGEAKSEILAVHAALLPTGKILIFAGDQYDGANRLPNTPKVDHTRLMDTSPPYSVTSVTGLPPEANLFCSGHALLEDGNVIVGSGTERGPNELYHGLHWFGPRESWRFDGEPVGGEKWIQTQKMSTARSGDVRPGYAPKDTGGRWYPTLFTLPDGRVLALGGHPLEGDFRHTNTSLEIFDPALQTWSLVGNSDYINIPGANEVPRRDNHSEYPRGHVLRDGSLFIASEMADGAVYKWTPSNDPLNWQLVTRTQPAGYRGNPQPYTTVLLPLDYESEYVPSVLMCGGQTAYVIRPESTTPSWVPTSGRTMNNYPRAGLNNPIRQYPLATLLPTGEVFISGGTMSGMNIDAIRAAEMYDPGKDKWRVLPEANRIRNYHSTALLMPNGAVWHSGSNEDCKPGPSTRDLTVEIYKPWYFCWSRPTIVESTGRVQHGGILNIVTPNARDIQQVVLIRCGSFTHAFNPDQRLVRIPFEVSREKSSMIKAMLPENPAILIVGYYLLFILNQDGVPSEGKYVQVQRDSRSFSFTEKTELEDKIEAGQDQWKKFIDILKQDPTIFDRLKQLVDQS